MSLSLLLAFASAPPTHPPIIVIPPVVGTRREAPPALSPSQALRRGMVRLTPPEAVMKAADSAPRGVYGVFELNVRRAEQVGPNFFVNSEKDYRDQRNLSIAIGPSALAALREQYGSDLEKALMGRKLLVYGYAHRVRVDFTTHGRPSGKYYFQTHVPVGDARQIELTG